VARDRGFVWTGALLFLLSATATVAWCGSMDGGMPMPGGWTMSMAWMRMPGQSWPAAAAMFLGMWLVMMAAMMLPSLVSMLSRYRRGLRERGASGLAVATLLVSVGYFAVWAGFGVAVYPFGIALAAAEMRSTALAEAVPLLAGVALVLAGAAQLSRFKGRQLARCRDSLSCCAPPARGALSALRHGLHLGLHCSLCCAGLIGALLVAGVMDLRAMAAVTAAITLERLTPRPRRFAHATGVLVMAAGVVAIARAVRAA
jgi:predicted metal-binding membrane protein